MNTRGEAASFLLSLVFLVALVAGGIFGAKWALCLIGVICIGTALYLLGMGLFWLGVVVWEAIVVLIRGPR